MKKLLSLIISDENVDKNSPFDLAEHIPVAEPSGKAAFDALKQVKGKYAILLDGKFKYADAHNFLNALDGVNADIDTFNGGYCIKTAILKGINLRACPDFFNALLQSAFAAKNIVKLDFKPFAFIKEKTVYSQELESAVTTVVDEFTKLNKTKIAKEAYSFAFDLIVAKLAEFYLAAMIAIHDKKLTTEKFKEFDLNLKKNMVLYLALENRFTADKLSNLRKKDFKLGLFAYLKFKKLV